MTDITPKEASEILSHYTDLGYGIIIEGEDTSKIKQAFSLARKTLTNATPLPSNQIAWEQGYEAGLAQGKKDRPQGEWIDHSETDGYVECPFCGSATTCEGNKEELHFCFNCGAQMEKGGAE